MAKVGRPSKFDGIDLDQVKALVLRGFTDVEISDFFKINEGTWNNWKKEHEEFFKSLKEWKAEHDEKVERSLCERAKGYSHPEEKIFCNAQGEVTKVTTIKHYPPDPTSMIFWLKNRQPAQWRDVVKNEHSGPDGGPIGIKVDVEFVKAGGVEKS